MPVSYFRQDQKVGEVECDRNFNLLAHAQMIELDIGSLCGGHGVCGGDRIRLVDCPKESLSPPTDHEQKHLTEEEIRDGWRLGCQVFPARDGLAIRVELKS